MSTQQDAPSHTSWFDIPYAVDGGIGTRAHIGMLVFDTDQTISHEARAMLNIPGIAIYESRLRADKKPEDDLKIDKLGAIVDLIAEAVPLINSLRRPDVVAVACTSAAMVAGPQELERIIQTVHPKAKVTDPFTGILTALRSLGSARIGFVSPYPHDIAQEMIQRLEGAGVQVPAVGTFHNENGFIAAEAPFISPQTISKAVQEMADNVDIDTIVVACTQMRAAAVLEELEQQTGKTVISSNQAMCWHALRLAGYHDKVPGWGTLFQTDLQTPDRG